MDLLTKVAAAAGGAHPGWCEECALPRILKLAMHRDYNIRVVSGWRCAVLCCAVVWPVLFWRSWRVGRLAMCFDNGRGPPHSPTASNGSSPPACLPACLPPLPLVPAAPPCSTA